SIPFWISPSVRLRNRSQAAASSRECFPEAFAFFRFGATRGDDTPLASRAIRVDDDDFRVVREPRCLDTFFPIVLSVVDFFKNGSKKDGFGSLERDAVLRKLISLFLTSQV